MAEVFHIAETHGNNAPTTLFQMVKIEGQQLITHAVMQDYMAQTENATGNRTWGKSPAVEVNASQKQQDQLRNDVMQDDFRMLEVGVFQTILIRYAGVIYNVKIVELDYPDVELPQNQLLVDTELILPMQSLANLEAETRISMSKEVHPEFPHWEEFPWIQSRGSAHK